MKDANIVKWSTFQGPLGGNLRIGFMSQVSPDGKYVLTTINDPRSTESTNHRSDIIDRYYYMNFLDYRFLQVFYPTRGILAWYSRDTGHLTPLPGADDDRYLQAGGVWSPDGKYIVFITGRGSLGVSGRPHEGASTPTIRKRHRFSTTCTASRSTTERAARRSRSRALRRTA